MADMFRTAWFPRSKELIISTYEKSVEHIKNLKDKTGSNWTPSYPYMVFNPSYEIAPDESFGRFMYQYPNLSIGFGSNQWNPRIYEDENLYVAPSLNRYKGTFDIIIWNSSVYELLDYRTRAYQLFGDIGRIITPDIEGYMILPDELIAYNYYNSYTKESYKIDWEHRTNTQTYLVKNINQNRRVFPFIITPYITLNSISDGSEQYGGGGADAIGDHKFVISCTWESWIPVHLILVSSYFPIPCKEFYLDMSIGFRSVNVRGVDGGLLKTPIHNLTTFVEDCSDSTALTSLQLEHSKSYCYLLTSSDIAIIDTGEELTVEIDESLVIPDCVYVKVFYKYGELQRDFQYKFVAPNKISFVTFNLEQCFVGDMISFEIYGKEEDVDRSVNMCN